MSKNMRLFIIVFITALISISSVKTSLSQNLYWVNGSGEWSDPSHWSLFSGGESANIIPTENNNVIFDDHSFNRNDQIVLIKGNAVCNDFQWIAEKQSAVLKSSSFLFKSNTKSELEVNGSININDKIENEFYGDIILKSSSRGFIKAESVLNSNIIIDSERGDYVLNKELSTNGNIQLKSGSFITNDQNIECDELIGSGNEERSIKLGNSELTVNKWDFEETENLEYSGEKFFIYLKTDNIKSNLLTGNLPVNVAKAGAKAPFVVYPIVVTDVTCFGGNSGAITISVEGGTKPYTYSVRNNTTLVTTTHVTVDTIYTFVGLTSADYYARVEHTGGGVFGDTYNVGQPTELTALAPSVTNPLSCFDGSDGELTANHTGGTGPYSYQWLVWNTGTSTFDIIPGPVGKSQALSNIGQGIYRVQIDDANLCGAGGVVFVDYPFIKPPRNDSEIPPEITFDSYGSTDECSGASNGTIDISAIGGTGDMDYYLFGQTNGLTYPLAPPPYDEDGSFTGLIAQTYETYAVDFNGCQKQGNDITIIDYPAPLANAGSDAETCEEVAIDLSTVLPIVASVSNASSLLWDDGGAAGNFDDDTQIHPTYTPAIGQTGLVTLTLTVNGNGSCASVNDDMVLTIKANSIAPTTANVDNSNFCPGAFANITLSYVGGLLGTGATAEWYSDAGFTTNVGSGQNLVIAAPATTTTYYVRFEGDCNNTTAPSVTVTIKTQSTDPISINSDNANFCPGGSANLTVVGGSLGTGATWEWYTGSCGGTSVGTGSGINVSPAATTTYYVRAEGDCNITACANTTITVKTSSIAPVAANVDNNDFCPGAFANITLSYVGGTLGTGATAEWYSDAGFTTNVGSGQNLVLAAPAVTTTYYVRFEGDCNNTTAALITVTIRTESTDPTGINTDNNNFCPGGTANLTVQGGSLGTGATWEWYTGSCGGVSVGNGASLNVSPAVTTTYYVRAEGTCNTTACVSITINVDTQSTDPVGINSDNDNFCPGGTANLTVVGGSLGTGATWEWYTVSCGGTSIGSGAGISVSPTTTTTYYVRAEGTCNTTACTSVIITVKTESVAPTTATVDNNNFCPGAFVNITLSYVGGTLGTGGTAEWYSDPGFLTNVGSGQNLIIAAPAVTTTYYVRFEGDCNNTTAASVTVTIKTQSTDPVGINTDDDNFCPGTSANLSVQGGSLGTGATWEWYSGSCGGTPVGSGATINVTPLITTDYFVRAEGDCNNTACANITITVKTESVAPVIASVDNSDFCPGAFANITLSYAGGTLGTGATAEWYSDAGFTTNIGSGQNLVVAAPAVTTTYYVRFEGDCNNTTAASVTVTVKTESVAPTSATVDNNNFCAGIFGNITLSYVGGTLGTGATAEWYSDAGYTVNVGSGQDLTIAAPIVTTTYYVRFEGDCNNTVDASVTVVIFPNPIADILPPDPVETCTAVDFPLDGNPSGGTVPYATHTWTGVDLTPLDDPNIQNPIFNTSTAGIYNFTYTVVDDNGCTANDVVAITVHESATVYAGVDTLLCYGSDYHILDADSSFCNGVMWTTDGGDGSFDLNTKIDPIYTPGPNDILIGSVKLVISATGIAPCVDVTDTLIVTYLPELIVSIGKPSPYLIDSTVAATPTHINVSLKITGHSYTKTLGVYLVSPKDSVVELKPKCALPFSGSWLFDADYEFYNDPEDTSAIMVIDECAATSGRYEFYGEWKNKLHGQDPANGAWRIRIVDTHPWGSPGVLEEAEITFLDYNIDGLLEPVTYAETGIGLNIKQKIGAGPDAITDYAIPITGLTTSCFGFCDATAIATAIGGEGTYTYQWSTTPLFSDTLSLNDTVDLCAGTYYVRATDGHFCSATGSVVVGEPDEIIITNSYVKDASCNGGTTGEIMLEFTGGTGVANLSYTHDGGTTWFASGDTIKNLSPADYLLTIRDLSGCEKDTTITINEPSAIDPGFVIKTISCAGFSNGEITSNPTNGTAPYDFAWSTGDSDLGVNSSTITGLGAGIYTVTITDANTCQVIDNAELIDPDLLTINGWAKDKYCVVPDAASRDLLQSLGYIVVRPNGGSGSYTYTWTGPAGFTPVDNDTLDYLNEGDYNLRVEDTYGCFKDSVITVNEDVSYDITSFNVVIDDNSICWYDSVLINGTYNGTIADSIFIQILGVDNVASQKKGAINSVNPFTSYLEIDKSVTLQIIRIYNDYCKDEVKNIDVTYTPDFNLDILDIDDGNAVDDTIYLKGATKTNLTANTTTIGLTYEWIPDTYLKTPNEQVTEVNPEESLLYKVIATSAECSDSSSIYLEYVPSITPNGGFSPNGDGINDFWKIKHIEKFKNNVVTIYNRWGVKVFEQKGYDNSDESKRWDGTKNGKDLGSGTYYYIILLNEPGFTDALTGPITIVR
jgi:gliding motility-associated-like protein